MFMYHVYKLKINKILTSSIQFLHSHADFRRNIQSIIDLVYCIEITIPRDIFGMFINLNVVVIMKYTAVRFKLVNLYKRQFCVCILVLL